MRRCKRGNRYKVYPHQLERLKGPGKRGHIIAHDVSWAAQTGKHLLRTPNLSEQNQKHFLCPGHKLFVRKKARAGKRGNIWVGNNVSSFARVLKEQKNSITSCHSPNFLKLPEWSGANHLNLQLEFPVFLFKW